MMALSWPLMGAAYALSFAVETWAARRVAGGEAAAAARGGRRALRRSPRPARAARAAEASTTDAAAAGGHAAAAALAMVGPCALVWRRGPRFASPVPGFAVVLCAIVASMKIVSYAHCNADLRARARGARDAPPRGAQADDGATSVLPSPRLAASGARARAAPASRGASVAPDGAAAGAGGGAAAPPPPYPESVSAATLAYFVAAPTLVYQPAYPRTPRVRARRVVWYSFKLSVAAALQAAIWAQYVTPTVKNSVRAVRAARSAPLSLAERVLKLSLPSTYSWVVMFVTLFDCYLTLLAELTRFADRAFFGDWWNARTVGQYWRTWNLPVHKFLLRHVFNPLRRAGVGRNGALALVFAVSAALHEIAVAVPLHLFRPPWKLYAFWGVLAQVPLVLLTEPLAATGAGNFLFWLAFCGLGQPVALILYFCDWVSARGGGVGGGLMA